MSTDKKVKTVVVTGDFTLDWNLARNPGTEAQRGLWEPEVCTRLRWQRGGAGLLADLLHGVADAIRSEADYELLQPRTPRRPDRGKGPLIDSEDPRYHHSFASWKPYDYVLKDTAAAKGNENEKQAWRVENFLGARRSPDPKSAKDQAKALARAKVVNDREDAQLIVLDDANLGFRRASGLWPVSLTTPGSEPWVLVKMSSPVAQETKGELWEHLCKHHARKLIVVMTVNDLRLTEVQISRGLSWERTAQDLVWEVIYNRNLPSLVGCAHVIASFNAAGAFLYSRDSGEDLPCRLIFDPEVIEGTWEPNYPGQMVGYSSCMTAGIARELMLAPKKPDIRKGIRNGLSALRCLHREGYGKRGDSAADVKLGFPVKTVVAALEAKNTPFEEVAVPMRTGNQYWTILGDRYAGDLEELASDVVKNGPDKVLKGVPLGRFGGLLTVDRQEIESLRSIGSLVSEYVAQKRPKRPLSIAVFGPPGSGKSFGISELTKALKPGEIEVREFNLSQFRSTDELLSALHQVRDIGLSGKIPLIFWDEFDCDFDSKKYGWLRYFLAPMQDGKFLQGDLVHPIGRAIFVFAGGTKKTLAEFSEKVGDEERASKVPDFISRLKGYLNVLGPNQRMASSDPYFVLRRAILLNSMLVRDAKQLVHKKKVQIDSGVLRAMLKTWQYKHGARSMESVIAMSQLDGKTRFERSSLPNRSQLDLHVDGRDFQAFVQELQLEGPVLEKLAKAAHDVFCAALTKDGWRYGPLKNDETKEHPSLVKFDQLPEDEQEQNRGQARDIPAKLAFAGCYMVPAMDGEPPFVFANDVLEELAVREHTRWMRQKARYEWRYAPETDKPKKLHNCMLPWKKGELAVYADFADRLGDKELPEVEKDKDRTVVREIARILEVAGYTIVEASTEVGRARAAAQK